MFALARLSKSLLLVSKPKLFLPSITSIYRFYGDQKDSHVDGRERLISLGESSSYPNFRVSSSLDDFRKKWDHLKNGERVDNDEVLLAGRIVNKRSAGSKLFFYDIRSGETMLQIMSSLNNYDSGTEDIEKKTMVFKDIHRKLRTGDVIGVRGIPGRTDLGELSILPKEITLLAPCLWKIPREWYEIKDPDVKYRQRYLDLIVSKSTRDVFRIRSRIISLIRSYMEEEGFMEVETSILSGQAGGAVATPFITRSNTQNQDLSLRISPELYLKELVVGGFDRVYEMGKVFRNEGLNNKHNYEFTSIEAYMSYQNYTDWMDKTEKLLYRICMSVNQMPTTVFNDVTVDFTPPYRRIDVVDELNRLLGILPNLNDEHSVPSLMQICSEHSIEVSRPITLPRILDTLIGHFIEPQCVQPTFIINHPMIMSPLSKEHDCTGKSERFELFVNGMEIINAYTEQNDPVVQESSFSRQGKQRDEGDNEIPPADSTFINALEYGMPPTSGWGMGVDRLVMVMTNKSSIRDVVLFPVLKSNTEKSDE